jgi:hypothetical protein
LPRFFYIRKMADEYIILLLYAQLYTIYCFRKVLDCLSSGLTLAMEIASMTQNHKKIDRITYLEEDFRKIMEQASQFENFFHPTNESINNYINQLKPSEASAFGLDDSFLKDRCQQLIGQDHLRIQQTIEENLGFLKGAAFDSILGFQEKSYRLEDYLPKNITVTVESVLATAAPFMEQFKPDKYFMDCALSSGAEYQKFAANQFAKLEYDSGIIAERRIEVTNLCSELLQNINTSLGVGCVLERNLKLNEYIKRESFKPCLYPQVNQHIGFVYSDRFKGSVEEEFNNSFPVRINKIGARIVKMINQINVIACNCGKREIFKPTNKTMLACGIIPSEFAKNEHKFFSVIDSLYFLLYEGSGEAKRLLSICSDEDLKPLWMIKSLRNFSRHDLEHGPASKINKKRETVANYFISLINKPLPIKTGDWGKAQLVLYKETNLMLSRILADVEQSRDT